MENTKTDVKIYLIKYTGNHPIATITPNRVFEIIKMENAVIVPVNKHAKKEYGEGPQILCSVGDRLTNEQATQVADTYKTTLIPVNESLQDMDAHKLAEDKTESEGQ